MHDRLTLTEKYTVLAIIVLPIVFTGFLTLAQWPQWWKWVIFERSPMTWMESVLLFSSTITAAACLKLAYVLKLRRESLIWSLITFGFLYLTLDERFAIHERIRDRILAPNDVQIPIFFWTSKGDYVLLLVLAAGLAALPFIIKVFKERRSALYAFIAAVFFTVVSVSMDSMNPHQWSLDAQRLEQYVEESLETAGMICFLISYYLMYVRYLGHFHSAGSDARTT